MTKEEFIAQLERGAATVSALPISSAMLRLLAADLRRGEPEWWKETTKAWQRRTFAPGEAWRLFLACIHYEVLADPKSPLVPYFPSCGGSADVEPSRALLRFLAEAPDSFFDNLKTKHLRRFMGQFQISAWVRAASLFFQLRGLPFYLVQIDAGAGIDLAVNLWSPGQPLKEESVAARIGLSEAPLDIEDINHRRWLTAAVPPDMPALISEFDRAAETLLARKRKDHVFVQLVDCSLARSMKFIEKNIPADDPDVGLLIFNAYALGGLPDAEYAGLVEDFKRFAPAWGDRLLWVEAEPPRGEFYTNACDLRATRCVNGQPFTLVTNRVDDATGENRPNTEAAIRFLVLPGSSRTPEQILQNLGLGGRK